MDFDTFCRSVLLAQNRFSDFLKATKTDRDKVLKGVLSCEQIDAAKLAADAGSTGRRWPWKRSPASRGHRSGPRTAGGGPRARRATR